METLAEEIISTGEFSGRGLASSLQSIIRSRPMRELIVGVLEKNSRINCYSTSAYLAEQTSFRDAEPIIAAIVAAGFPVEKIRTVDKPKAKMRTFVFETAPALPDSYFSVDEYDFNFSLGSQSNCELVEVKRETQPDLVTYRMECPDDPLPTVVVAETFDSAESPDDDIPF